MLFNYSEQRRKFFPRCLQHVYKTKQTQIAGEGRSFLLSSKVNAFEVQMRLSASYVQRMLCPVQCSIIALEQAAYFNRTGNIPSYKLIVSARNTQFRNSQQFGQLPRGHNNSLKNSFLWKLLMLIQTKCTQRFCM